jgi:hypothetical protein
MSAEQSNGISTDGHDGTMATMNAFRRKNP